MRIRFIHVLCICFGIVVFFASCSNFEKTLKSHDVNYKFTKANEYYDKKEYLKANQLYERLVPVLRNTRNFEQLYYRWCFSFYYMKDYLSASYHFKNFIEYFPSSKDADECEFMHGLCLYKMSPKYSLDQTNTEKAMEALQSYVNTHPNSKRIAEANQQIDAARAKLEAKEADAAKLYFNINQFKASGIAFKSVLRNYPESNSSDYYQFMILKSNFNYAKASVIEKQEERFSNALNAYKELIESYPKSKYLREAEKIYSLADTKIKQIRNEHK